MVLALAGTMLYGCSKTEPKATDTQKKATDKKEYKIAWYVSAPHPFFEDVKKGVEGLKKTMALRLKNKLGQIGASQVKLKMLKHLQLKD